MTRRGASANTPKLSNPTRRHLIGEDAGNLRVEPFEFIMPTDPNNPYVDVPHEKTVIGPDYRYGCHSDKVGSEPRGRTIRWVLQDGWTYDNRRSMIAGKTEWIPRKCGHEQQAGQGSDPHCRGCVNRKW